MYFRAHKRNRDYEAQMMIWQAWHQANFERAKRMPSLQKVLADLKGKPKAKEQSAEQMLRIARDVTFALGGKVSEEIRDMKL